MTEHGVRNTINHRPFSASVRDENLIHLADETFDVLVIGGGITGAAIARDAAMRGFRTALVEKGDFAVGTSSRSTRLVHGGIRYLEYGELRLVFDACTERRILRRIAPRLVRPLAFLYPSTPASAPRLETPPGPHPLRRPQLSSATSRCTAGSPPKRRRAGSPWSPGGASSASAAITTPRSMMPVSP